MCRSVPLSVVIPTRDRIDDLVACVRSVLQDAGGCGVELIVVDDGEVSSVRDYLAPVFGDAVVVLETRGRGVCAARNEGIAASSGEFVAFIDDDDVALAGWVEAMASGAGRPDVGVVCVGAQIVGPSSSESHALMPRDLGSLFCNVNGSGLAGTFAVRRSLLERTGGFWEKLAFGELTELWLRLAAEIVAGDWEVSAVARTLVEIRRRPPESRRHTAGARYQSAILTLERHKAAYGRDRIAASDLWGVAGHNALLLGRRILSLRCFLEAVAADPRNVRRWLRLARPLVPTRPGRIQNRG